ERADALLGERELRAALLELAERRLEALELILRRLALRGDVALAALHARQLFDHPVLDGGRARQVLVEPFDLLQVIGGLVGHALHRGQHLADAALLDRKSTRLNSSHVKISYAVF